MDVVLQSCEASSHQKCLNYKIIVCHTRGLPGIEGSGNVSLVEGMKISAGLYAVIKMPVSPASINDQS